MGTSFPRWKANLNTRFHLTENLRFDTRVRYIDAMKNRAAVQYIGESFTGTDAAVYVDVAFEAEVENLTFRLGLNNAFDRAPEQYAPNVQSGTDPSLYDVIGRRFFASVNFKF